MLGQRQAMRDQSNLIIIQANEAPKEVVFIEKGNKEESYEYEEESYYEEDAENNPRSERRNYQSSGKKSYKSG